MGRVKSLNFCINHKHLALIWYSNWIKTFMTKHFHKGEYACKHPLCFSDNGRNSGSHGIPGGVWENQMFFLKS